MNKNLGHIIVLSGPSGVGKSTLVKLVRQTLPDLRFSVSCTTRPPRPGERNDVDYHFISKHDFEDKLSRQEFVEHAQVFANYYGTLKSEVLDIARAGGNVVLDIDVQGAMQIKAAAKLDELLKKCTHSIFIVPPSLAELEKRLRGRASDSEEQIQLRLSKAEYELSFKNEYDQIIVNDTPERAAAALVAAISGLPGREN